MRRVTVDPFRILLAIEYLGQNGAVKKEDLISYLGQFSEQKKEVEGKSIDGAANDVLFNLKKLRLIEGEDSLLALTNVREKAQIQLFSGKDIFDSYQRNDKTNAIGMLQTNVLFYSPEVRNLLSYIYRKRGVTRVELQIEYNRKKVHGHIFNLFTIDTTIAELERLELIRKGMDGIYTVPRLHDLVFAQLLTEEVIAAIRQNTNVSEHEMKDLFDLKFGLTFDEFSAHLSRIRNTTIPNLTIPGNYGKFSISIDVAKEANLI